MKQYRKDALMLRKLFSRRSHPRYLAEQKTYLVFQPSTSKEKKFQVIDISEGGCAFIYHGDEKDIEKVSFVSLMRNNDPQIERINITTANDQPASGPFRRRGVEFRWLGLLDEKKLRDFIKKVSICEIK